MLDGLDGAARARRDAGGARAVALPAFEGRHPWDDETIERASRGLLGAIDDAEQRGSLNGVVAAILRPIVERAPVQWLIDGGQGIAGLFD